MMDAILRISSTLLPIEAAALPGRGRVVVTGVVSEEELSMSPGHTVRRKGTAQASADNAATLLKTLLPVFSHYDVHVNFPGGAPVDGPSAGLAIAVFILLSAAENDGHDARIFADIQEPAALRAVNLVAAH